MEDKKKGKLRKFTAVLAWTTVLLAMYGAYVVFWVFVVPFLATLANDLSGGDFRFVLLTATWFCTVCLTCAVVAARIFGDQNPDDDDGPGGGGNIRQWPYRPPGGGGIPKPSKELAAEMRSFQGRTVTIVLAPAPSPQKVPIHS